MIKGCVYTVGSPQYLSSKFGTEFKIDVGLIDEIDSTQNLCTDFFQQKLPESQLDMIRPKSRIYSVPAVSTTLPQLFTIMEAGKQGPNGFDYYTCSSSSLERVFMEIVRLSEQDDDDNHGHRANRHHRDGKPDNSYTYSETDDEPEYKTFIAP